MTAELQKLRKQINQIDDELLTLLHQRQIIVHEIGKQKQQEHLPLRDLNREQQVLSNLKMKAKTRQLHLSDDDIDAIFHIIMQRALDLQVQESHQNIK
ncbi:hypothetical protein A6A19_04475 [Actinobacillus delphinicola]|uniref:chorismate mutase n=1 Tax=Actinobacillus delphinicola TaxID=51161 RepID=A0A448TSV4_9PAST|nr:chorismate mutase [Actinobacillus delphinicola]MDG6897270.1 hypothetical protein [Actinobacillus delphinicola]VEJ09090.1 chorismate mutase [Actinobacillus delphinicola]